MINDIVTDHIEILQARVKKENVIQRSKFTYNKKILNTQLIYALKKKKKNTR